MKNLCSCPGGGTQDVRYLVARPAELSGDRIDRLSRQEKIDHVLDRGPPARDTGPAEGVIWVHRHLGHAVLRKPDQLCATVACKIDAAEATVDPAQVLIHHFSKDALVVSDNHELACVMAPRSVCLLGVVIENLGPVGVKLTARQRMLKTELLR